MFYSIVWESATGDNCQSYILEDLSSQLVIQRGETCAYGVLPQSSLHCVLN